MRCRWSTVQSRHSWSGIASRYDLAKSPPPCHSWRLIVEQPVHLRSNDFPPKIAGCGAASNFEKVWLSGARLTLHRRGTACADSGARSGMRSSSRGLPVGGPMSLCLSVRLNEQKP
jgi:hypothetical protein